MSENTNRFQSYVCFNNNMTIDFLKVQQTITDYSTAVSERNDITNSTIIFANYEDDSSTAAQYYDPDNAVNSGEYSIYKKTPLEKYYTYLDTIASNGTLYDYNIRNNEFYHYEASVKTFDSNTNQYKYYVFENTNTDKEGQIESQTKQLTYHSATWDEYSICNIVDTDEDNTYIKDGTVWNFKYNLNNSDITQNLSVTTYETLGTFAKHSYGKQNYDSSSITVVLGDIVDSNDLFTNSYAELKNDPDLEEEEQEYIKSLGGTIYTEKSYIRKRYSISSDGTKTDITPKNTDNRFNVLQKFKYANSTDKIKAWKAFCVDGNLKLLKDIKGNSWIIQIVGTPNYTIDNNSGEMLTTISFNWEEVADVTDSKIIYTGSLT